MAAKVIHVTASSSGVKDASAEWIRCRLWYSAEASSAAGASSRLS